MEMSQKNNNNNYTNETLYGLPCDLIELCSIQEDNYGTLSSSTIVLRGNDTSGLNRPLLFQLVTIPSHGRLLDERNFTLSVGSFVGGYAIFPYTEGVLVRYEGTKDFFTYPPPLPFESNKEYFEFRVIASSSQDNSKESSLPVLQEIIIINVNDPTIIADSEPTRQQQQQNTLKLSSFNLENECDDDIDHDTNDNGDHHLLKSFYGGCLLPFKNITVIDPDKNVDFVRVDIDTSYGLLSLDTLGMSMSIFISCTDQQLNSTWKCKGSGSNDGSVSE